MQRLVAGHRTLSGYPNLIEDWEYEAIDHVIAERTVQLTQGFVLPADVHRAWMMVGEAYGCDSPEAASFAGFYRRLARQSWLSWVQAFEGGPGCVSSANETDRAGFVDFKQQATTPEAMTAAGLAPLTVQENQAIAAAAGGLIEWVNVFCRVAGKDQSAPELWNRMATAVRAPWRQDFFHDSTQDRERSFNLPVASPSGPVTASMPLAVAGPNCGQCGGQRRTALSCAPMPCAGARRRGRLSFAVL